jgi:hypothetical protein
MLNTEFIGLNLYFAVNLLAALVAFAVFWLIFDAWTVRHSRTELVKWAGFLVLAIGFLFRAASIRTGTSDLAQLTGNLANILRVLGYLGIVVGQFLEPLQARPEHEPDPTNVPPQTNKAFFLAPLTGFVLPILTTLIAALYLRRATTGLERHLRPVAIGFFGLTIFELLSDFSGLAGVTNPNLYRLVATYGPIWWASLAALLIAVLVLGAWVWQYLVKRLQSQLFMLLVAQTLAVFLFSTVGFTFMLLRNAQSQTLDDLSTASHVLGYAVSSLQSETAAQADAVSQKPAVASAVLGRDHNALAAALNGYMPSHHLTLLIVTDVSAQVWLHAEDPGRWGDSVSSDPLVRRSLVGDAATSVAVSDGVVAPTVTLVASSPLRDASGTIIGTVTAGHTITGSFVDGIRSDTGLESSVYGGKVRAATTLAAADGSRAVGIKETSATVTSHVLDHGQSYAGPASFQNRSYLAAYTPLRDVNNTTVGMLLVARPTDALFAAANHSVQLTLLFVIVLIIISVYPIYLVARYLSRQLK